MRRPWPGKNLPFFLALCACLFLQCQTDEVLSREEKYVTVRLNDSLKRYDSVEIVVLAEGDSAQLVGAVWKGPLAEPGSVPSYRLPDGETRELSVRVRGYDSAGNLTLNQMISRRDGAQVVADLPLPVRKESYGAWGHSGVVTVNLKTLNMDRAWFETGMPLLIRLTRLNFDFSQAAADGRDIRFSKLDGTPIAYEVARWEPANNRAEIWFRADTLRVRDDSARFRIYWGNADAKAESAGEKVFGTADKHAAVYHLAEQGTGAADEYKDAGGRYHGQAGTGNGANVPKRIDGVVDYAQDFRPASDGASIALVGHLGKKYQAAISLPKTFDPGAQAWTFQAWVRRMGIAEDGTLFRKGEEWLASKQRFQLILYKINGQLAVSREGAQGETDVYLPLTQFVHMSVVYQGGRFEVFVDGFRRGGWNWTQGEQAAGTCLLGASFADDPQEGFDGYMDEVWLASATRSPMWMRMTFENQRPGSLIVGLRK